MLAYGLSLLFTPLSSPYLGTIVLGVWFAIGVLAVSVFGFTPGQFVAGMRVMRVDLGADRATAGSPDRPLPQRSGSCARWPAGAHRVPGTRTDQRLQHGRALHDRATGTALIRTR